jgi:ABC-2 type transport system ATP-binding protein
MLSLRSVVQRYESIVALDEVSLDLAAGEFFGLLGPNGAGKSTLMSLVAGLRSPTSGTITLNGAPLSPSDIVTRSQLGLVPQSIALYEELSAEENLHVFGQLHGLRGAVLRERIAEALEAVQLTERRLSPVNQLSGGMQRRLNLVAALLHRPKLLLCDEPSVGVDPQSRHAIFDFLEKRNCEGLTIIYSTHYMEEAARLCSRIGIIHHGKLRALGTLEELLTRLPFEEEISFPACNATTGLAARLRTCGELVTSGDTHRFRPHPTFPLSAFYELTESHGISSRLFIQERPSLEAVFLQLTGRTISE